MKNQLTFRFLSVLAIIAFSTLITAAQMLYAEKVGKHFKNAEQTMNLSSVNKVYEFINGKWFDGKSFQRKTFYSAKGVLTGKRPAKVDETIDLKGDYVVPPFADAHTHHFDSPRLVDQQVEMYLRDGVFYAKTQANLRSGMLKVAGKVNSPMSVDVSYAHGSLTHTFGHGLEIFETMALGLIPISHIIEANKTKIAASHLRENDGYYIIDTAEDLEQKWRKILEGNPGFLKINLLHSEKFAETLGKIPNIKFGHIGLDPRLVPLIVQKARAANLRVSSHIETAADYRVALAAGVDEMAHLPGYYFTPDENPEIYQLTEKDVIKTVKGNVWVIPTPNLPESFEDKMLLERVEKVGKHNLRLLKKHRARIAFGADAYMATPVEYVLYIGRLDVFTNLEMLKIWCEDTPQTIFPNRKIGHLRKGYEASFLVLEKNPLQNLEAVKEIRLRFKQGYPINISSPDRLQEIIPTADHHTHIWSLNASTLVTEPLLPAVSLSNELASLLQKREKGWNDKSALAQIYTQDSLIIQSDRTWIRGREMVSARASEIFAKPYRIKPIVFEVDGSSGYIAGYIVRDTETGLRHFGHVMLSLKKNEGVWQIAAETLNFPGPPVPEEASAGKLVAHLDAVGTKRAAVLSVAFWFGSVFGKVDDEYTKVKAENDWVAGEVAKYPTRLVGFCSFNPLKDYALEELERCTKNRNFKGLKLHFGNSGVDVLNPQHVEKLRKVFSAANKMRFPVIVHLWTPDKSYGAKHSEAFLNQIVSAAPDITIQIAHLAASGPGYHSDDALEVFANAAVANNPLMKNLYFDVASIVTNNMPPEALEFVTKRLRQIGLQRVLFASDFAPGGPNASPKDAWEAFRRLPLSKKEFGMIAENIAPYMR